MAEGDIADHVLGMAQGTSQGDDVKGGEGAKEFACAPHIKYGAVRLQGIHSTKQVRLGPLAPEALLLPGGILKGGQHDDKGRGD